MNKQTNTAIHTKIIKAIQNKQAIVALESAVITHGLPYPVNIELAKQMELIIQTEGAIPATAAFIDGTLKIGLSSEELNDLGTNNNTHKISRRDFGIAAAKRWSGGLTVAGTLIAARQSGIHVFATGGIGGVHRGNIYDVSADLQELAQSPIVVICAGAKSILDLPATLEVLETLGVPVVGYQTEEFPAFYARESGLKTNYKANNAKEIAELFIHQKSYQLNNAILVVNPIPKEAAIPSEKMESFITQALEEAAKNNIFGSAMTPFLLDKISSLTKGESLQANLALLKNNARLAAEISREISALLQPNLFI
ncbi:MAG: pseudouridine-5-phosphate glycosidase [Anaerolineaceae bacterium]|nr:pseudouridine-5-phosphate glycosidase [Anaerolineaceae bacterium]